MLVKLGNFVSALLLQLRIALLLLGRKKRVRVVLVLLALLCCFQLIFVFGT